MTPTASTVRKIQLCRGARSARISAILISLLLLATTINYTMMTTTRSSTGYGNTLPDFSSIDSASLITNEFKQSTGSAFPASQPRPKPLHCSDIHSMPQVKSKTVTNTCVAGHPFQQSVHTVGDIVSAGLAKSGCWESDIMASIVEHFGTDPRPDRVLIDIGGNIGAFTTTLANLGHQTITVEPFRLNVPIMMETLCLPESTTVNDVGDRIKVFKVALSDKSPGQKMCLWSTHSVINNGNARLVPYFEGTQDFGSDRAKSCMEVIYSYTLDELLGLTGDGSPLLSNRPWGLKIDIEGYETLALRGASKLLTTPQMAPCRIWFEYQRAVTEESGAGSREIFDLLLRTAGYAQLYVSRKGQWTLVAPEGPYPDVADYMVVHGDSDCQVNAVQAS